MARYTRMYFDLLAQNIKTKLEYRVNFFIGGVSTLAGQVAGLLTLWVVMETIPTLKGWTLHQLLLIYGLLVLSKSLNHMFADNLWRLGWAYIRTGDFDRYLVRPVNPLFHLIADRFCEDGIGNFVVGLGLLIYSSMALDIPWTFFNVMYTLLMVLSGGLVFFGINLITASLSFWMTDSLPLMWGVFETHEFAKYPLKIYHTSVNVVFTWILPFGIASYYPASYLLGHPVGWLAWIAPVVALVLVFVGYGVWKTGLSRYTGAGS